MNPNLPLSGMIVLNDTTSTRITYIISIVALCFFSGTFGAQQYCLDVTPQQDVQSSGSPGWGQ